MISGCSSTDKAVTACQVAGWAAVAGDGPLWPRVTVGDGTFCDLQTGVIGTAGPVLRRWYVYQADGAVRVQVPAIDDCGVAAARRAVRRAAADRAKVVGVYGGSAL